MSMHDPLGTSAFADDSTSTSQWAQSSTAPALNIPPPDDEDAGFGGAGVLHEPPPLNSSQFSESGEDEASSPQSHLSPGANPYGREPQIYGQPDSGLISPSLNAATNGKTFEKNEPYLRVRITALDRNRRDILVRFDAQTNLSNFTGTTYRNISRSFFEFQQFYESIISGNPQTIIPALPLPQTSAPTDEEDDRLIKIMLQRWLSRICEDPILIQDEDVRAFIESDFGYQPVPRPRRKGGSGFSLIGKRAVPDEDEELQKARFELTKLEGQFFEAAKAIDKLSKARRVLAQGQAEMGNKLVSVATAEAHPPLGNALRKLGRTWHSLADLDQAQAISECVILADSLGYQSLNARSARETLLQRTSVLEEYQAAVKTTIGKRRNIERLKAASNIRPERVDEALEDLEEATKYEQILQRRVDGISQNLHRALQVHNRYVNDDITTALIEHVRSTVMYERQLLRELEALRPDVQASDQKVVPVAEAPRPMVVPPLEDFSKPRMPPVQAPGRGPISSSTSASSTRAGSPFQPSMGPSGPLPPSRFVPVAAQAAIPTPAGPLPVPQNSISPLHPPLQPNDSTPVTTNAPPASVPGIKTTPPSELDLAAPPLPAKTLPPSLPVSPLTPTPQTPPARSNSPPLGGRWLDGSRSMFISPSARMAPSGPLSATPGPSPLGPGNMPRAQTPTSAGPMRTAFQPASPSQQQQAYNQQYQQRQQQMMQQQEEQRRQQQQPQQQQTPYSPLHAPAPTTPTRAGTMGRNGVVSPLGPLGPDSDGPISPMSSSRDDTDPLGLGRPAFMSQSVRVQPTRPRMDAREAASKLANMF